MIGRATQLRQRPLTAHSDGDSATLPSSQAAPRDWLPVAVHGALCCVLGILFLAFRWNYALLFTAAPIVCVIYLWIAMREAKRSTLALNPLSFYFFWDAIAVGVAPIYIASLLKDGGQISFSVVTVDSALVVKGYILYMCGGFFLHCGLRTRPLLMRVSGPNPSPRFASQTALMMVVGIVAGWHRNWFAGAGALSGILQWSSFAAVCTVALGRRYFPWSGLTHFSVLCVGCLILAFINLDTGSKYYIMLAVFPLLWFFVKEQPVRKMLPVVCVAFVISYLYIVAPVVTMARTSNAVGMDDPRAQIYDTLRAHTTSYASAGTLRMLTEDFLFRQYPAIPMAFLAGHVSDYGLQWGATMDYAMYALIPRVIWRNKPNVSRGAWFTAYLGFSASEADATTSTGITASGELYWNFGLGGLAIGMFIIGAMKGYLWSLSGANPLSNPFLMLLYVFVTFTMPDMPEAVTVVVSSIYCAILFGGTAIAYRKMFGRDKQVSPPPIDSPLNRK